MLARRISSELPRSAYDGIHLMVASTELARCAQHFFSITEEALAIAAARAPGSFARCCRDVEVVVLIPTVPRSVYNRFQLAVLVPVETALTQEPMGYAGWLLYASGLARGKHEAIARADELLRTLDYDHRARIRSSFPDHWTP
jgi:hypothetical protein